MATITIGAGKDYATLYLAKTYIESFQCVAQSEILDVVCYDDIVIDSSLSLINNNCNAQYFVRIRPVTGVTFPKPITKYPTTGIKITITNEWARLLLGNGMAMEGFRGEITAGITGAGYGHSFAFENKCRIRYNAFKGTKASADGAIKAVITFFTGTAKYNEAESYFKDNFVETAQATGHVPAFLAGNPMVLERNTIISADTGIALRLLNQFGNWTSLVRDNVIDGNIQVTADSANVDASLAALCKPNWRTGTFTSLVADGVITYPTDSFTAITSAAFESGGWRPAADGPLIGTASAFAKNTNDINLANRGPNPDGGAIQRTPSLPLPTATVGTPACNGQIVTLSGTTTGNPTSGTISLVPSNSPNGAVLVDPTAITLGTNSFTVTFTGVQPGNYTIAGVITLASVGSSNFTGAGFSIDPITGIGQAPDITPGEEPEPEPVVTIVAMSGRSWRKSMMRRVMS